VKYPKIAAEFHMIRNKDLRPEQITPFSNKKVWWLAKCGHEWEMRVIDRTQRGHSCPYCTERRGSKNSRPLSQFTELVPQWHAEKNPGLSPVDLTSGSQKKAWWKCEKGHEWVATVASRTSGRGCPYCAGQKVSLEKSLGTVRPDLLLQWDFERNQGMTSYDVLPGSGKKAWWICVRGHRWLATIKNRVKSSGCPECWNRRRRAK
jgi:hypothetical protein